jgi:hypothetical protein
MIPHFTSNRSTSMILSHPVRVLLLLGVVCLFVIASFSFTPNLRGAEADTPRTHSNVGDETSVKTDVVNRDVLHVELGSGAYYAHETIRSELKSEIKAAKAELDKALSKVPASAPSEVTRGIIAYLPPGLPHFVTELKWLFLSIGYMRTSQPENFKTDLILFTGPEAVESVASEFKCRTSVRSTFKVPEGCIVLPHVKLMDRPVPAGKAPPPLREYAAYVDSMQVLADFEHTSKYTYLLRTDLDCFITPGFSDWVLPDGVAIAVGKGGYGHENSNRHLSWLMTKKLGLEDGGMQNLGSTWMGYSDVMKAVARLTLATMNWLHTQEFSEYEKKGAGVDSWPYWHWPVILLYGGHIALNQMHRDQLILSGPSTVGLDEMTTNPVALDKKIKHLHIFHGDNMFSKFKAHAGKYKNVSLIEYLEMDSPRSYATVLGISSMRLSKSEVVEYANDKDAMKNKDWIRIDP